MPLSTSVKSITASPLASCKRTMSRPLIDQAAISLVNGSAAAHPFSNSSRNAEPMTSPFRVTTQVLLRSAVESSHCPTISLARSEPVCDDAAVTSAIIARTEAPNHRRLFVIPPSLPNRQALATLDRGLRNRSRRHLAFEPGLEVVDYKLVHSVAGQHGGRTDMGQQHDVLHCLQLVGDHRFVGKDV